MVFKTFIISAFLAFKGCASELPPLNLTEVTDIESEISRVANSSQLEEESPNFLGNDDIEYKRDPYHHPTVLG